MRATKTLQINRGNTQYHDRFFAVREYDWTVVLPWSDARNNYDNYITIDVYVSDSFHGTDEEWTNYRKRLAEIALIEAGLARETLSGLLWL